MLFGKELRSEGRRVGVFVYILSIVFISKNIVVGGEILRPL
jgi:hypothetical protein